MQPRLPATLGLRIAEATAAVPSQPSLIIQRQWLSSHGFWLLPVGAFLAGFGVLASRALTYYKTVPESPGSAIAYVLLAHAFLVLFMVALAVHAAGVVLFNRTVVSVTSGRVVVREGPLPPSTVTSIRTREILRFIVEDEPRLMPPLGRCWSIVGELANGRRTMLVGGLATEEDARLIAHKLAKHCGVSV